MPYLNFASGNRALFAHPLRPGRTLIGRSDRCDVALPSDEISRTHCVVEKRGNQWWVVDRSRHGTLVNGTPITAHPLEDDDQISFGTYTAQFSVASGERTDIQTASAVPLPPATHEELVEITEEGSATCLAQIRFTTGPRRDDRITLKRARTDFGGPGSGLVIGDDLPRNSCFVRVVRGRAMIEPGNSAVFLAGKRVRRRERRRN